MMSRSISNNALSWPSQSMQPSQVWPIRKKIMRKIKSKIVQVRHATQERLYTIIAIKKAICTLFFLKLKN